jgi:hypothetical protein
MTMLTLAALVAIALATAGLVYVVAEVVRP